MTFAPLWFPRLTALFLITYNPVHRGWTNLSVCLPGEAGTEQQEGTFPPLESDQDFSSKSEPEVLIQSLSAQINFSFWEICFL